MLSDGKLEKDFVGVVLPKQDQITPIKSSIIGTPPPLTPRHRLFRQSDDNAEQMGQRDIRDKTGDLQSRGAKGRPARQRQLAARLPRGATNAKTLPPQHRSNLHLVARGQQAA